MNPCKLMTCLYTDPMLMYFLQHTLLLFNSSVYSPQIEPLLMCRRFQPVRLDARAVRDPAPEHLAVHRYPVRSDRLRPRAGAAQRLRGAPVQLLPVSAGVRPPGRTLQLPGVQSAVPAAVPVRFQQGAPMWDHRPLYTIDPTARCTEVYGGIYRMSAISGAIFRSC